MRQHQASLFLEYLIHFLMPFFLNVAPTIEAARLEILQTLASYGARTRREYLHAAQVIAFGLAALDTLAEAKIADLSPSMRLRYRSAANGLNRACQQNEKALSKLLTCDAPAKVTAPKVSAKLPAAAEPLDDLSEADLLEALNQAKARIDTTRNRLSNARASAQPRNRSAIFKAIFAEAVPPS